MRSCPVKYYQHIFCPSWERILPQRHRGAETQRDGRKGMSAGPRKASLGYARLFAEKLCFSVGWIVGLCGCAAASPRNSRRRQSRDLSEDTDRKSIAFPQIERR